MLTIEESKDFILFCKANGVSQAKYGELEFTLRYEYVQEETDDKTTEELAKILKNPFGDE